MLESACFASESRPCEVRYAEEARSYPVFPPTEVSLENEFRLRGVAMRVLIDHRRGHYLGNVTELLRCSQGICPEAYSASLSGAAAIRQASSALGLGYDVGSFVEKATFTKLRELSVRIDAPAGWARSLGASRMELSLAGRNLMTWTAYSGLDPEANAYGDTGLTVGDHASAPLARSLSLRVTFTQ